MTKRTKNTGAQGFGKDYWQRNYSEPDLMDGIGNAKEHTQYLKAFFELEDVEIRSMIDFGFGLGHLFKSFIKTFRPLEAVGLEPSRHIFEQVTKRKVLERLGCKVQLEPLSLQDWVQKGGRFNKVFDLGICTSVCQYLEEEELEAVLPIMAKRVKYLYLTVPTDQELEVQVSQLKFRDVYALGRSREYYQRVFGQHFTFVSGRVLESRAHFDESNSSFSDFLFRF